MTDQTETINDILTKNETVLEVKNEASDDLPKETESITEIIAQVKFDEPQSKDAEANKTESVATNEAKDEDNKTESVPTNEVKAEDNKTKDVETANKGAPAESTIEHPLAAAKDKEERNESISVPRTASIASSNCNNEQKTPTVLVLGESPRQLFCPHCKNNTLTCVAPKNGLLTYLLSAVICFCGGFCGCCLIPLFVDRCRDVTHCCTNCRAVIGVYKRI